LLFFLSLNVRYIKHIVFWLCIGTFPAYGQENSPLLDSLQHYEQLLRKQQRLSDTSSRAHITQRAEAFAAQAALQPEQLLAYKIRGTIHALKKEKPKAWFWYKRALQVAKELGEKREEANICYNLSNFLVEAGQPDSALVYSERALRIDKAGDNPIYTGYDLVQLGGIYAQMQHPKEAAEFLNEAKNIFEKASFPVGRLLALEKLAELSAKQGRSEEAISFYKDVYTLADSLTQHDFALNALNQIIIILQANKEYGKIRRYLVRSQHYHDKKNISGATLATSYSLSAREEQRAKRFHRGILREQKALKINTELGNNEAQIENYKRLASLWMAIGDSGEAYSALQLAFGKLKNVRSEENQVNLKEAELRFALNLTQKELELNLEKEEEEQRLNQIIYGFIALVAVLMLTILFFMYRLAHQRKNAIKTLEKNNAIINQKNEELKELNEVLDAYSSTVSHDLRSPINSMLGLLEVAKHDDDQTLREIYLPMFEKNLHKLRDFIEDLLAHTKNQRQALKPKLIELDLLISEVMEQVIPQDGRATAPKLSDYNFL